MPVFAPKWKAVHLAQMRAVSASYCGERIVLGVCLLYNACTEAGEKTGQGFVVGAANLASACAVIVFYGLNERLLPRAPGGS